MTEPSPPRYYVATDEPTDLKALGAALWHARMVILAITAVFAVSSTYYALTQPEIYRSEALLAPAESGQPSNPFISQLGAAAGLVGLSASNNSTQVKTAIALLKSREFLRSFIARHDLKPVLSATSGLTDVNELSDARAVEILRNAVSVTENPDSGLVLVAAEWTDPVVARDWVTWLVADVNAQIKQRDLQEATSAIEYLQEQLQATQLVEMQRAFYQLIESQTRVVMLADVRDDYVFRTIDPAFVPEQRIRPVRSTIVQLGTFLGGMLGVLIVLLVRAFRGDTSSGQP